MPRAISTDAKRLQQILKNLLSNAFKFTDRGSVALDIEAVDSGWNTENDSLNRAKSVLAFTCAIPASASRRKKQQIIFEASSRRTARPAANTAAPGLGPGDQQPKIRRPARWARSNSPARRARFHFHSLPARNPTPLPQ